MASHLFAQRLEIQQQVFHHLIPLVGILTQGLPDDAGELRWEISGKPRQRLVVPLENRRDDVARRSAGKTTPSDQTSVRASTASPRACSGDM
jgi:hypothetical protein